MLVVAAADRWAPLSSEAAWILVLRDGAVPSAAGVSAACDLLRRRPETLGCVTAGSEPADASLALRLCLQPESVAAALLRGDWLRAALGGAPRPIGSIDYACEPVIGRAPPLVAEALGCAWTALAALVSGQLLDAPVPLAVGPAAPRPAGAELAAYIGAAIRAVAIDDAYPQLRPDLEPSPGEGGGPERDPRIGRGPAARVPCMLDWAVRAIERQVVPEGFALGAQAAALAAGRDDGCGLGLSAGAAPFAVPADDTLATPTPPASPASVPERLPAQCRTAQTRGALASLRPSRRADPLVTLIVPTLSRTRLLRRALGSVAHQTFRDVEVVVVNDGGIDPGAVVDACRPGIGLGDSVTLVHHDRNRGLAAARNTGLHLARGRFVGFLDDDDCLLPGHLAALVPHLLAGARTARSEVRVVRESSAEAAAGPVTEAFEGIYCERIDPVRLALDNQLPVHALLCERGMLLESGGFFEPLRVLEDWDLWLRVLLRELPVHVPRVTAEVRVRGDGTRMTESRAALWPDHMAVIYGRTIELERRVPGLRSLRARYLAHVCVSRGVATPDHIEWTHPGDGLEVLDLATTARALSAARPLSAGRPVSAARPAAEVRSTTSE